MIDHEYIELKKEINDLKKFLIERPLIILFGFGTLYNIVDVHFKNYLPAVFVVIIIYNCHLSISRIFVMSKIVGYLQVIHEMRYKRVFIGWENYLRIRRKLENESFYKKELYTKLSEYIGSDSISFCAHILLIHLISCLFLFFMSIYPIIYSVGYCKYILINGIIVFLIFSIYLIYCIFKEYLPSTLSSLIEVERNRSLETINYIGEEQKKRIINLE